MPPHLEGLQHRQGRHRRPLHRQQRVRRLHEGEDRTVTVAFLNKAVHELQPEIISESRYYSYLKKYITFVSRD